MNHQPAQDKDDAGTLVWFRFSEEEHGQMISPVSVRGDMKLHGAGGGDRAH